MTMYPAIQAHPVERHVVTTRLYGDGYHITVTIEDRSGNLRVSDLPEWAYLHECAFFPDGYATPWPGYLSFDEALRVLAEDIEYGLAEVAGLPPAP